VDWRDRARCRAEDPELFFPVGTGPQAQVDRQRAKAICRQCPSIEPCRRWALSTGQDSGVWGGLDEDERRALRRREQRRLRAV
jgi:WhiB family redox-sensing transcriptional regulator